MYESWCTARSESSLLAEMSANDIEEQLCRFVMECRRQDGEPYPPSTLYGILAGLQRFLRGSGRHEISFFTTTNHMFARLRLTLDARMKQLTSSGIGVKKKQAEPLTQEHERMLWDTGVFDLHTAQGLIYITFFYNCKLFGLRGGDEHRALVREQFVIVEDSSGSI